MKHLKTFVCTHNQSLDSVFGSKTNSFLVFSKCETCAFENARKTLLFIQCQSRIFSVHTEKKKKWKINKRDYICSNKHKAVCSYEHFPFSFKPNFSLVNHPKSSFYDLCKHLKTAIALNKFVSLCGTFMSLARAESEKVFVKSRPKVSIRHKETSFFADSVEAVKRSSSERNWTWKVFWEFL